MKRPYHYQKCNRVAGKRSKIKMGRSMGTVKTYHRTDHEDPDNPRSGRYRVVDSACNVWWYLDGYLHREDGPAVERRIGATEWRHNGLLHREDGPAVIWTDDDDEWYVRGDPINSYEELQDTTGCPDEDIVVMKLRWVAIVPQF